MDRGVYQELTGLLVLEHPVFGIKAFNDLQSLISREGTIVRRDSSVSLSYSGVASDSLVECGLLH